MKMKKLAYLFLVLPLLWACNPEQVYTTRNVEVSMRLVQLSAGFAEYEYKTNKDAYYAIGIVEKDEFPEITDPFLMEEQFKSLVLDEYYMYYIIWRHELLLQGVPYIADYPSHTLFYGTTTYYHIFLKPDTEYWSFAFVVDPKTNKAAGPLVLETIRTLKESEISVKFLYRVQGTWDYSYPMHYSSPTDTIGNILSNFPYMSSTRSKDYLVQWCMDKFGDTSSVDGHTPAAYFIDTLRQEIHNADPHSRVLFGEFAYNNVDEYGDPKWEVGKEYYSGFAGCDGDFNVRQQAVYRFTWQGEGTRLHFTEEDKLRANEW